MARKTGQKTVKIELPTGAADDQAPASTAGDDDIEQAFSQLPEGTIAKIYRMIDGREAYVTSMAPNAASEEAIAKLGPGTYIVRMWGPIGDGNRKGYKGQRQVMIAAATEAVGSLTVVGSE